MTLLNKMLEQSYKLKVELDKIQSELTEINDAIIKMAEFTDGKKTAHLHSGDYCATVVKRVGVEWDQELLGKGISAITEEEYNILFKVKVEPASKKTMDDYIASGSDAAKLFEQARCEKEQRPSVKVMKKEGL